MKNWKWNVGAILLAVIVLLILIRPLPFLASPDLPHAAFFGRAIFILLLAAFLCLLRVIWGPTGVDRIVAVDLMGILILGLCAMLTIATGRTWYLDVGIAWALQSFITVLALSKYLEGRTLDT